MTDLYITSFTRSYKKQIQEIRINSIERLQNNVSTPESSKQKLIQDLRSIHWQFWCNQTGVQQMPQVQGVNSSQIAHGVTHEQDARSSRASICVISNTWPDARQT